MKPRIRYDRKLNILSIRFSRQKSVDSDIKENVVIDYDKNGEIVNIDVMKTRLGEFVGSKERAPLGRLIKVLG